MSTHSVLRSTWALVVLAAAALGLWTQPAASQPLMQSGYDVATLPPDLEVRIAGMPSTVSTRAATLFRAASSPVIQPVALRVGTIAGRVVDAATQQPIGTVQVHIPALEVGTLTGPDGFYTIPNVPAGQHTVVAEVIGYRAESQTVTVVDDSVVTVNFQLAQTAVSIEEVVAVGYGQQTRATLSGSVSSVSSAQFEGQAFTNASDALQGLVQGVSIRMMTSASTSHEAGQSATAGTNGRIAGNPNDGRPGSPATLQIRNMGSPLIVIDGVPSSISDFNAINPSDIENISILKDASAAVYGFRAANGVVLVTTKRGNPLEAPRIRIDGYYGWQNPTRYHFMYMTDAYEYKLSMVDSNLNLNQPPSTSKEDLEKYRIGAPGYESTDHWPLVWNKPNAPQYSANATLSGGMDNARYYLSVGHVQQDYNIDGFTWGRTNFAANLQASLSDRLTIGTELRAQQSLRDEIAMLGDQDAVRTALLTAHSSWPFEHPYTGPNKDLINAEVRYLVRSVATINKDVSGWSEDIQKQTSGNFWAEYRFPFGTGIKATFSIRNSTRDFDLARKAWDAYCHDKETDTYYACYNSGDRTRQHLKSKNDGVFGNVTVNHAQSFGLHSVSAAGFLELDGSENTQTYVIAQSPHNYTHIIEQSRITEFGNSWGISRRASMGGRIDYDYDRKYLFSALARYDGSYLYAPGKRWGFFPGVSVGWRLTEENFIRERFGFLNELKLRASWGQTGREQGVSAWGYLGGATYGAGAGYVMDGTFYEGVRPRGLPVTNLSWVTSTAKNIGVDLLTLNGRLSAEIDFFERELTGLPAARTDVLLPSELGYSLPNENLNSDVTRGFEMAITWSDQIGRLQYSLSPNMTIARDMPTYRYRQRFANSWNEYRNGNVGRWSDTNWGYEVIGQFRTMEEIANHPVNIDGQGNRLLLPGDLMYRDVNNDGIINAMDMRPIGYAISITPILSFGMGTRLSYRGFTFTANLAGATMYSHLRDWETRYLTQGGHNMPKYAMDRWRRADPYDPQSEWIPGRYPPLRVGVSNPSFNRQDTFWLTNVRFLRVRRAELGYNVPDAWSSKIGLSGLRVYTNVQNPFSLDNTAHYGFDPEVTQNTGIVYPTIRLLNIGFSANVGGGLRTLVAGGGN